MCNLSILNNYKNTLIGKTIYWITCNDVVYENNVYIAKCVCKCGNKKDIEANRFAKGNISKSCGCYKKSKEFSDSQRQYILDRPEIIEYSIQQTKKWKEEHPEEVELRNKKVSEWSKNNPDKVEEKEVKHRQWFKNNPELFEKQCEEQRNYYINNPEKRKEISDRRKLFRCNSDITKLVDVIHPDYIDKLLNTDIKTYDIIKTRCPICGNYSEHKVKHVFIFSSGEYKNKTPPLCDKCHLMNSNYEEEIISFINSFYKGNILKNIRSIISPLELDIYIPEKEIAIEFNGNYFHSELFKSKDYHVNKFIKCKEKGILLISIFESEWNNKKDEIKEYIKDTFNNITNKFSYIKEGYVSNNYPDINNILSNKILEDYYVYNNKKVYTCGYTKLE